MLKVDRIEEIAGLASSRARASAASPEKGIMTGGQSAKLFVMPALPATRCANLGPGRSSAPSSPS